MLYVQSVRKTTSISPNHPGGLQHILNHTSPPRGVEGVGLQELSLKGVEERGNERLQHNCNTVQYTLQHAATYTATHAGSKAFVFRSVRSGGLKREAMRERQRTTATHCNTHCNTHWIEERGLEREGKQAEDEFLQRCIYTFIYIYIYIHLPIPVHSHICTYIYKCTYMRYIYICTYMREAKQADDKYLQTRL